MNIPTTKYLCLYVRWFIFVLVVVVIEVVVVVVVVVLLSSQLSCDRKWSEKTE